MANRELPIATANVYALPTCMPCRQVKRHLAKLGIPFTEIDPVKNAHIVDRIINTYGLSREAPLVEIIINGEHHYFTGNHAADLEAITYLAKDHA